MSMCNDAVYNFGGLVATEITIKLVERRNASRDRLLAYCSIVLNDAMVIHGIRIIDGPNGICASMPSHKVCDHCPECNGKNALLSRYCNNCGVRLDDDRYEIGPNGRPKLHTDVIHPIDADGRAWIEDLIVEAYIDAVDDDRRRRARRA